MSRQLDVFGEARAMDEKLSLRQTDRNRVRPPAERPAAERESALEAVRPASRPSATDAAPEVWARGCVVPRARPQASHCNSAAVPCPAGRSPRPSARRSALCCLRAVPHATHEDADAHLPVTAASAGADRHRPVRLPWLELHIRCRAVCAFRCICYAATPPQQRRPSSAT